MLVIGLSTIQGIMARPNVLRFVRSGGRAQAKRHFDSASCQVRCYQRWRRDVACAMSAAALM